MPVYVKRIVLDVLKPHRPGIVTLSKEISTLAGITGCNITLIEIDKKVENVKITVEGPNINFEKLNALVEDSGGTIHSVDKVSAGKKGPKIVEEAEYMDRNPALR